MHARFAFAAFAALGALPGLAHAQSATAMAKTQGKFAPEDSVFEGDYVTIGVGALAQPSYEGSDHQSILVLPVVQGRVWGVTLSPRQTGLALDFIPAPKNRKFGFSLGPIVSYSGNRAHDIDDPVVEAAGRLKVTWDMGVATGVTAYKLFDQYDSLALTADIKWNINGASNGMVFDPALSYFTPVSRAALVTFGISAEHVDSNWGRYYFSVTPGQSAASGLPIYTAHSGWTSVGLNLLGAYDLDNNLLNGGFAIFALGSYSKLLGDAKDTPYTSIRGSSNQWTIGAGVAYTFGFDHGHKK
jgi:outer membrane scaffolding protein for murein synthesis (MipA/OmpV family)